MPQLPEVKPGGPRTLLLLGSDHRAKTSIDARLGTDKPLSDTIVLVRLDPKRKRIAVMSLPRDLAGTIPGVPSRSATRSPSPWTGAICPRGPPGGRPAVPWCSSAEGRATQT